MVGPGPDYSSAVLRRAVRLTRGRPVPITNDMIRWFQEQDVQTSTT